MRVVAPRDFSLSFPPPFGCQMHVRGRRMVHKQIVHMRLQSDVLHVPLFTSLCHFPPPQLFAPQSSREQSSSCSICLSLLFVCFISFCSIHIIRSCNVFCAKSPYMAISLLYTYNTLYPICLSMRTVTPTLDGHDYMGCFMNYAVQKRGHGETRTPSKQPCQIRCWSLTKATRNAEG